MTTKVRITHLDNIDPVKVVVKDGEGKVVSETAIAGKGDEFEGHVYSGQTFEVVEGVIAPAAEQPA